MQNRYTADIGDFSKYGLMRMFAKSGLSTALAWYMVPDEAHNADGRHINYIGREKFRQCDPLLHEVMAEIVSTGQRNIRSVEKSHILGKETLFHSEILDFSHVLPLSDHKGRAIRGQLREKWLSDCVTQTKGRDAVFFDPDNGIQGSQPRPLSNRGPKYLYWSDLSPFISRNQSLVIYNHASRQGGIYDQISRRLLEVRERVPYGSNAFAMLWRSFSVRYYLVVPTPAHQKLILSVCKNMMCGSWGHKGLFELVQK